MSLPGLSLKRLLMESHSVPVFEGKHSRRHRDVPYWKLAVQGGMTALKNYSRLRNVTAYVQFVGFPRSGHSLIGSILDAHPQAIVSHELDAMGLIRAGFPASIVYALITDNSAKFSQNGRYWNGFSYSVPGQWNGRAETLRVIGDKKGDWAVRWYQRSPDLVAKTRRTVQADTRWILVMRHPLDNIATMSLRKNRTYDALRIAADDSESFRSALNEQQAQGEIASVARDDMLDDYEGLCTTITQMWAEIPPDQRVHVPFERFCLRPQQAVQRIWRFLGSDADEDYVAACASIVRSSTNKSRNAVSWDEAQLERVAGMVRRFSFLQCYEDDVDVLG